MFWAQVKMIRRLVHVSYSLAESDFLYTLKRACIHVAGLWIGECMWGGGGGESGLWVVSENPARNLPYLHALHDLTQQEHLLSEAVMHDKSHPLRRLSSPVICVGCLEIHVVSYVGFLTLNLTLNKRK